MDGVWSNLYSPHNFTDVCKGDNWIREGCTISYRRSRIQRLPQKSVNKG